MAGFRSLLRNTWRILLAVVVLALVPAVLEAAGIGFRNDTNQVIYVQGASLGKGGPERGKLLVIKPGQTAWDVNLMKGVRTIAVYDAANRVLFLDSVNFDGATDQFFSVQPVPPAPKMPPRVKLKELPVPAPGM